MRLRNLGCLLLFFVLGCQIPVKGYHEYDVTAPFRSYVTYAWVTDEPILPSTVGKAGASRPVNPFLEGQIRKAIESRLALKRYQKLDNPEKADLVVTFSIGTRDKVEVSSYPVHGGYYPGYRYGYSYGSWATDVRSYTEGTLAIDFLDRATKKAVWHGWATKRLPSGNRDAAEREALINEVVGAILEEFPGRSRN